MKIIFVYCEGAHDISLLKEILVNMNGLDIDKTPLKNFIKPFDKFYAGKFNNQFIGKLALKNRLPDFVPTIPSLALKDSTNQNLFLFYAMTGDGQYKKIIKEINEIKEAVNSLTDGGVKPPFESYGHLLFYDADTNHMDNRIELIRQNFKEVFPEINSLQINSWNPTLKLGCYVFHRHEDKMGTLEDIVEGVIKEETVFNKSKDFIAQNKNNFFNNNESKEKKARLTSLGQFLSPGSSLAVAIQQDDFLNIEKLKENNQCKEISNLFTSIMESGVAAS